MSYFVTAIAYYPDEKRYDQPYKCTRTFGHFETLEDAQGAVRRNDGDMYECLHNYLVIEEVNYGIHAIVVGWAADKPLHQWWYRWEHPNWTSMDLPEWSKGFLGWSIG